MKNIKYLMILITLIGISCSSEDQYKNHEGFYTIGKFYDTLKQGEHISFYNNGHIRQKMNYINDTLNGEGLLIYEDSIRSIFKFKKGRLLMQLVLKNTDTVYYYIKNNNKENIKVYYLKNKKPEAYINYYNNFKKQIKFDSLGNLKILLNPPLDFLTKKDSLDLDKAYPNWKEQVQEYIKRNKN